MSRDATARSSRPMLIVFAVMLAALAIAALTNRSDDRAPVAAEAPADDAPAAGPPITVAATGDIMMGTPQFGLPPDDGRTFFDPVADLLTGDVVMGNLEGTLSTTAGSKCGPDSSNCFAFQSPPEYAETMAAAGFNVMNLANNHANDFDDTGLQETVAALTGAGIQATGLAGTRATIDADGRSVAVLGFAPYPWADPLLELEVAAERVRSAAADADIVVVTFHAGAEGADRDHVPEGPEEYLGEPRGDSRAFAHAVIDAGADLVVGHGPHVLRGMEVYGGRLIAYSLGNFAGYRAFSLDGALARSMVLSARIAADGRFVDGRIHPTELVGEGTPAPGGDAIATVRRLSQEDFGTAAPAIGARGVVRPRS